MVCGQSILFCGALAAALSGVDSQGTSGCTDSWADNFEPTAQAEDGSCLYTCAGLLEHADQTWLGGATCYVHSGGTWPSALTSMAIDVPVGTPGTLQVNSKAIVQGVSNTSTDSASRTLLAYRFQVGASGAGAGGTGTGALALRHVNLEPHVGGVDRGGVDRGGAVQVMAGSYAMLMNVTFNLGALLVNFGGGIYGNQSTIIVSGCYFGSSVKSSHAGAILVESQGDVPSTLTVVETIFNGSQALSDGAGGIVAKGSAIEIRSSSFTNCVSRGYKVLSALDIQDSTSVQIVDTTFSPMESVNQVINTPLDNNVLGLLTTGCARLPCEPGKECSMSDYSLHCTPCQETAHSPDGRTCLQCPAGKQPNTDSSDCEKCPANEYSVSGKCAPCLNNTIPSQTQTACTGAYRCPSGHECLAAQCYAAGDCTPCRIGYTSADGDKCTQCGTPVGREIDSPYVRNADSSLCMQCVAGTGPNAARDDCDNCTGNMYSTYGVCQNCSDGTFPAQHHTKCDAPYRCGRGQFCPLLEGCGDEDCADCPAGKWNVDGGGSRPLDKRCTICNTDGEAVTAGRDACTTCANGKTPSADHSICVACTGTNYSTLGAQCRPCQFPQVVGAMNYENAKRFPGPGHSLCEMCPPGKGPAGCNEDQNGVLTCALGCTDCIGNTHSNGNQFPQCQTCPQGKINTQDHHDCGNCQPHQDYVDGISNVTGECSCGKSGGVRGTGYYNTTVYGIIVCFMDGYHPIDLEDAIKSWKRDESMQVCQECPPCANCTSGSPVLHNGYISQYQIADWEEENEQSIAEAPFEDELQHLPDSVAQRHQFTFAFFCDEETAVGVNETATFGYSTTELANARCLARPLPCPRDLKRCESNPLPASGTCPEGYEGFFCRSCVTSTRPAYHATRDRTCQPCNEQYDRYGRYGFISLGVFGVFLACARCCKKRRARLARRKEKREQEMNHVVTGSDDVSIVGDRDEPKEGAQADGIPAAAPQGCCAISEYDEMEDISGRGCCCGCCSTERLDTLKDIFRSGKIPVRTVVTYLQVTAQLSKVYHTQYPPMVQGVLNALTPIHDFFSIIFSAECTRLFGRSFGGFQMKWVLRVLGFPMVLFTLSLAEFVVAWITARVTLDPKWAGKRAEEWAARNSNVTGRQATWRTLGQRQLLIIFLVYPTVVNVSFSALDCRAISPSVYVLVDDDRIVCPSGNVINSFGANLQTLSLLVLTIVGFFVPTGFGFLIWSKGKKAAVQQEDIDRVASVVLSSRSSKLPSLSDVDSAPVELERAVTQQTQRNVEATIRQLRALGNFKFLTDAYNPALPFWETVDLLRKFCLVGLVVLAGRGSAAQIAAGNALSFGFFAAHMKFWPMKTHADNYLRMMCEVHVLMCITVAFVLKSDLSHEIVHREFYDWLLIISGTICVPLSSLLCVTWKMRELAQMKREKDWGDNPEAKAYARFSKGITSDADQRALRSVLSDNPDATGGSAPSPYHESQPEAQMDPSSSRPGSPHAGAGGLKEGLLW